MANRFVPASLCEHAREFGRVPRPEWKSGHVYRPEDVAAARLQHQVAYNVRKTLHLLNRRLPEHMRLDRLRQDGFEVTTLAELADLMGESEEWLKRKFNGQVTASLTDLAGWTYHVNRTEVWPVLASMNDLTMPGDPRFRPTGPRVSAWR